MHLECFPAVPASWRDDALAEKWRRVRNVRRVVTGALEIERAATRIGSSGSTGSGFPLRMSQKGHDRVQTLPRIRNVAVWREKQSPMLGQLALSHTVWRSSVRKMAFVSR